MLCFAAMEAVSRLIRPQVDLYQLTGRHPGPNPMQAWAQIDAFSAYRGKPGKGNNKSINSHGFVSTPEITLQKPTDTIRVVFLGGSSTAGTGWPLPDAETWPWITMQLLGKQYPLHRLDFINGALGGYTSFESYGRLWSRLIHFKPDVVIVNHGWNEMYYFDRTGDISNWRTLTDGSWSFEKTIRPIPIYQPSPLDPLVRWSQLLTVVRLSLSTPNQGETAPLSNKELKTGFTRSGLEIWRTHLKLFRETCRTLDIRLFVIKQPTLIVAGLPATERRRCRYDFHGFDHDAHVAAYAALYKIIDEEIQTEAVIDLTALSGKPELFFDHVHPNPTGNQAIAAEVANFLKNHRAGLGNSKTRHDQPAKEAPPGYEGE